MEVRKIKSLDYEHGAREVAPAVREVFQSEPGGRSLTEREWLTTEQAADYLGLSVGALRNMTSNGQVPHYKLGRRNRYLVVELRQLLSSQKRGVSHGN